MDKSIQGGTAPVIQESNKEQKSASMSQSGMKRVLVTEESKNSITTPTGPTQL